MKTNQKGIALIKQFEGLRLTAYQDIVGVWTIGYGHTINVKEGDRVTSEQAERLLEEELPHYEERILTYVKVPLNSNEFSALVSFAYNLGTYALKKSTLLKKLNFGLKPEAAAEFPKWNKAGGKVVAGLTRRRLAEQALFLENNDESQQGNGPEDFS